MKRTNWAVAVAVAGVLAAAGLHSPAPAAAHVLTQMSPVVTYSAVPAVPAVSVRCRTNATPLAVLASRGRPGQRASYGTFVNSKLTHTGVLTADRYGMFVASTAVADHRRSGVVLQLSRRSVVRAVITPNCGHPVLPAAPALLVASTRGSATAFTLNHNGNGSVTRWNPCGGDIHVRVNATLGGLGALADAQAALAALSGGTGLRFVYDGLTSFVPTTGNSASQPATVVIAWAPPGVGVGKSNYYSSGAVGEGGWRSSGTSSDGGTTWTWKIVQGFVVVDPGSSLPAGFGSGVTRGALLLHELGHVAGLGHTNDGSQVMYPVLRSSSFGSYGAGDLAGLKSVGVTKGCTTAS